MLTDSKDLHITKLVDFIARIPEHLDLYFSDFSTNLYQFYKFTVLNRTYLQIKFLQIGPSALGGGSRPLSPPPMAPGGYFCKKKVCTKIVKKY